MRYLLFLTLFLLLNSSFPSEALAVNRQEIEDFYLSNLKEDGSSDWEIKGKNAIIDGVFIDIETMDANYYFNEDIIHVKSNQARLNRQSQDMHLKGDVKIKNQDGWNLETDYLDWQQIENYIKTNAPVKTEKDLLLVNAEGLYADSQLKRADFYRDVQVTFSEKEFEGATTINCDGPLEIEYSAGKAIFKNNVVVKHQQGKLFSDTATLFFDSESQGIIKIISEGNVKIIRDDNITFAQKATYFAETERLILEGKPRLIYFPQRDRSDSSGFFGIE